MRPLAVVDFETDAIAPRPHYPPRPVGVAIALPGERKGRYYAWGHRDFHTGSTSGMGNNCTLAEARKALRQVYRDYRPLCHHAGFDLDVAETHLDCPWPAEFEDSKLLGFLVDPERRTLSLKPLAEHYLGEPPEEQDRLQEWIIAHVPGASRAKGSDKYWAKYICCAPVSVAGPYALGDIGRTRRLFNKFMPIVKAEPQLLRAYEREKRASRVLVKMERRGLPMDVRGLERDIPIVEAALLKIEDALARKLKVKKAEREEFKWSGPNFAERLLSSGLVDHLPLTDKGNYSTSAESLLEVMPAALAKEFEVRSQLQTCLSTFMRPWLAMARETGGYFFASFKQIADEDHGARTGRLSMTPNLQNVIRGDKDPRVPKLREYVATRSGLLVERDYSQQELRLLGHFEDGPLKKAYLKDPTQDGHTLVKFLIQQTTGMVLERRPVKDLNFGLIYGQGLALTAKKMGLPIEDAARARKAHGQSLPGVPALQRDLKRRAQNDEPIWTWGGRRYYCEKPRLMSKGPRKGQWVSFDYKLLNTLIQGSAADVTKQAMVNYDALGAFAEEHPMLLQIHDALLNHARTKGAAREVHRRLAEAMLDIEGVEIPMLSDGKTGASWGGAVSDVVVIDGKKIDRVTHEQLARRR